MPRFTIQPDPELWHEVPGVEGEPEFVEERTAGLEGDSQHIARTMAMMALAVRGTADDLTLLLQEPQSDLYAVATFSMYDDRDPVVSGQEALALVTEDDPGPWDPSVVPVDLGKVQGFRISEIYSADADSSSGADFTAIHLTQTTYVVSVGGRLATVSLSPAPSPAAGVVLALVEPVISTWEVAG